MLSVILLSANLFVSPAPAIDLVVSPASLNPATITLAVEAKEGEKKEGGCDSCKEGEKAKEGTDKAKEGKKDKDGSEKSKDKKPN